MRDWYRKITTLAVLGWILISASVFTTKASGAWTKLDLSGGVIIDMISFPDYPDTMICGLIQGGLYRSFDRGQNWTQLMDTHVYDIALSDNNITYVATSQGLFSSSNYGNDWTQLIDHSTWQVIVHGDDLVIADTMTVARSFGSWDRPPWLISADQGETWDEMEGTGSHGYFIGLGSIGKRGSFMFHPDGRVYRSEENQIYRSHVDSLGAWTLLGTTSSDPYSGAYIFFIEADDQTSALYGYSKYYDFHPEGYYSGGIFRSEDHGESWEPMSGFSSITAACISDSLLFVGATEGTISVKNLVSGDLTELGRMDTPISSFNIALWGNAELMVASDGGIYKTTDGGDTWLRSNNGILHQNVSGIQSLLITPTTERLVAGTKNEGIFLSDDRGTTWSQINSELYTVPGMLKKAPIDNNYVFAGGEYLWASEDAGESWIRCENLPAIYYGWYGRIADIDIVPYSEYELVVNYWDHSMDHYPGMVYAEGVNYFDGDDWWWSTVDWFETYHFPAQAQFDPKTDRLWISQIPEYGGTIPALISVDYESSEILSNVTLPDSTSADLWLVDSCDFYVFNRRYELLWVSHDAGANWSATDMTFLTYQNYDDRHIYSPLGEIAKSPDGEHVYFVYPGSGTYFSANSGSSWFEMNDGLETLATYQIEFSELHPSIAYLATDDGLYTTQVVTGIKDVREFNPDEFSLIQNYPNPFNSSTIVEYRIGHEAPIQITVFDLRGRLIRTLVENTQPAGSYTLHWDGQDDNGKQVSSGIYIVRLSDENQIQVVKMTLLR